MRKLRGALLRLVLARWPAVIAGVAVAAPGVVLLAADYAWEAWYTDGLALILTASGAALLLAGLGGRRPDWIDPA